MRLIFRFAALLILLIPVGVTGQEISSSKKPRVLFLLDGSSSMSENWNDGKSRFQQAGKFILGLIDSLTEANSEVEFGLRVFGHQYPSQEKNCYDTKMEIKFSRYNRTQMEARLEALHGYGVSPIAFSLIEAASDDFENESKYAYSIILVTDGGESCGGDICKVANDLLRRKIFFRPYIVSLVDFDYAPLKEMYKCLGTFLTVSIQPQMNPVISKIVDAHREGFVRAKTGTIIPVLPPEEKKPEPVVVPKATPAKVDTIIIPITIKEPAKKIEPKKVDTIIVPIKIKEQPKKVEPVKRDTIIIPITIPAKTKEEPKKTVVAQPEKVAEPKVILQVRDKRIIKPLRVNTQPRTFKTIEYNPPRPKYLQVPPFILSAIGDAPPAPVILVRKKETVVPALVAAKKRSFKSIIQVIPQPKALAVPPFQLIAIAPPPVVVPETTAVAPVVKPIVQPIIKPAEKPIAKTVVKKTENEYVIEKTVAQETLVEVYFTDGNGRFYSTTPEILLSDPVTNKSVKQFYRTVNPEGNPDPAKVPSGSFNLSVVGSDRTFLKAIEIAPNMKNKIVITVSSGSLQFVWKGAGDKKPVDKYYAVVKRNFVPQPVVKQRCDTIMPYPPGNYHIEINTLPPSVRSTDLTFGSTVIIPVDRPGTIQITNTNAMGKANFYYQHGDRFSQFHAMNITGNPASQNVEVLPGIYEVHYAVAPGLPEKTLVFYVVSNETKLIELK